MNPGPGQLPAIIGLVVIVALVITRTHGQPVRAAKLLILPAIVLVAGVASAIPAIAATGSGLRPVDVVIIVADLALSLGLGAARGASIRVYPQDGALWYRYGAVTVVLWAVSIGLRFALGALGTHVGGNALVTSASVLSMLGLSLMAQNILLLHRAWHHYHRA